MKNISILCTSVVLGIMSGITATGTEPQPLSYQASVVVTTDAPAKTYDPMIFGGFIEHFGRQIYGGLFEPGSPLADDHGFRLDVIEAIKELRVPVIRWPGGCFVDSYHWQKGVGAGVTWAS